MNPNQYNEPEDYARALSLVWSGVNNRLPAEKLPAGLVADAENVRLRNGDIEPRLGVVKPAWLNTGLPSVTTGTGADRVITFPGQVQPAASVLYGVGVFADPATREWVFLAGDGGIWACAPNNFRQGVSLPPGVAIRSAVTLVQAFNQLFCFRGRYLAPLVLRSLVNGFEDVLALYDPTKTYTAAVQTLEHGADEMAYGPFISVVSLTGAANTVTVETAQPHGYVTGADITLTGCRTAGYNGRWNLTVVDDYTFTFQFPGSAAANPNAITLTSLTVSSGTATATSATAHGLNTGDRVTISGAVPDAYNGTYTVTTIDATHFSYALGSVPAETTASPAMWVCKSGYSATTRVKITAVLPLDTATFKVTTADAHSFTAGMYVAFQGLKCANMPEPGYLAAYGEMESWSKAILRVVTVIDSKNFTVGYNMAYPVPSLLVPTAAMLFWNLSANAATPWSLVISSLTMDAVTKVVTATVASTAGLRTGVSMVQISGATPYEYTGLYRVTVIDDTHFTYQLTATPGANATTPGTATALSMQCSNMSQHWKALGDRLTLAAGNLTSSGTTATVKYTAHGLTVGSWISVSGATPAGFNGQYQVDTVADPGQFTYTLAAPPNPSTATGIVVVYKSTVTPGATPDTNPEAWSQIYNILPNADDGLYINGRLLVPTAYTPGDTGYDSTSSWTKKDYIVALDIFDPVHFTFTNGFRINQGDDSEITNLVKYDNNTVLVTKGKRWGVLSNLQSGDYSQITFDLRGGQYGCPAVRSALAAGKDVYFPAGGRGLVSLNQTSQGLIQGVDLPFSADVPKWVARINWNAVAAQRVAWWNNYLYWAVALDSAAANNALLVYDFQNRQWASLDTGAALCVKEFFTCTVGGRERLGFLGNDGWVNLLEEATAGDQVSAPGGGVTWAEIPTAVTLAGELFGMAGQKTFPLIELGLAVWNANFSVTVTSGGMRTVRPAITGKTFSRTKYLKPFDRAPWNPLNPAGDWAEPNRGDYSVALADGINLTGCSTLAWQELFLRPSTKSFRASYALIRVTNATGRLKVKQIAPAAQPGERRRGLAI